MLSMHFVYFVLAMWSAIVLKYLPVVFFAQLPVIYGDFENIFHFVHPHFAG